MTVLGSDYSNWQRRGAPGNFNWEDYVGRYPGGTGGTCQVNYEDLEEMFGGAGGGGFSDFFRTIFGFREEQANRSRPQMVQQQLEISIEEAYKGATRILQNNGKSETGPYPGWCENWLESTRGRCRSEWHRSLSDHLCHARTTASSGRAMTCTPPQRSVYSRPSLAAKPKWKRWIGKIKLNVPAGTQPEQVFQACRTRHASSQKRERERRPVRSTESSNPQISFCKTTRIIG